MDVVFLTPERAVRVGVLRDGALCLQAIADMKSVASSPADARTAAGCGDLGSSRQAQVTAMNRRPDLQSRSSGPPSPPAENPRDPLQTLG